ncbi:MAG TPA: hypothetical protein ENN80_01765, partial [Candidatus Hydrogenedentes bacterium]|nr:hypothetical protein [Candidatus Hydrogenedentota bacterium]
MAICKSCENWYIRPDDVHCAACGRMILDFAFEEGSDRIPIRALDQWQDVTVKVRNTGQACVDVLIDEQAPSVRVAFEGLPVKVRIPPKQQASLAFRVNFIQPPEGGYQELFLRTNYVGLRKPIRFYQPGEPDVHVRFGTPGEVVTLVGTDPESTSIEVANRGRCAVTVAVADGPAWLHVEQGQTRVNPFSEARVPCTIRPNDAESAVFQSEFTISFTPLDAPPDAAASQETVP